jgi:outer membrane protein OmpA-like peptidoglycan-associated protein
MRVLIIGCFVFVIWSFFSVWLYVEKIKPAMNEPVPQQVVPKNPNNAADSLMRLIASMPKDLIIYFEFDKTKFVPQPVTDTSIVEFISWLNNYPGSMLTVTGKTDFIGSAEYNKALGLERALTIVDYLKSKGIDPNRIMTDTKVGNQSFAEMITSEGRARNRSTVVTIKK